MFITICMGFTNSSELKCYATNQLQQFCIHYPSKITAKCHLAIFPPWPQLKISDDSPEVNGVFIL